jgi:CheY-like chemotaxis protein
MSTARALAEVQVLIIEDEFLIALYLEEALRHLGFTAVRCTGSVAQARKVAAAWQPHLLTADLHLPDGNGREAVQAIQASYDDGWIAAIYLTANPELLAGEPDAITLGKPFGDADLRRTVERALMTAVDGEQMIQEMARAASRPMRRG